MKTIILHKLKNEGTLPTWITNQAGYQEEIDQLIADGVITAELKITNQGNSHLRKVFANEPGRN